MLSGDTGGRAGAESEQDQAMGAPHGCCQREKYAQWRHRRRRVRAVPGHGKYLTSAVDGPLRLFMDK